MSLKVYLQHAACSAAIKRNADFRTTLILASMLMSKKRLDDYLSQAMADRVQNDDSALYAVTQHDCASMHVTVWQMMTQPGIQ